LFSPKTVGLAGPPHEGVISALGIHWMQNRAIHEDYGRIPFS